MSDAPQPVPESAPNAGPAPAPGYAPPPAYVPPRGYVPPAGYTPPAGYGAPSAPAAPYGAAPDAPSARRGAGLGIVALVLSLVATLGASLLVGIATFRVGLGAGREIAVRPAEADFDWSILTPVRDWVLLGEVAFWAGTVIGVWALVQGVVAIVTGRGRGAGIAAAAIAAAGPVVFGVVAQGFLSAGFAAGSGIGG